MLLTFNKLPFVINVFVLTIFEWPFYTGFTVLIYDYYISKISITKQQQRRTEYFSQI